MSKLMSHIKKETDHVYHNIVSATLDVLRDETPKNWRKLLNVFLAAANSDPAQLQLIVVVQVILVCESFGGMRRGCKPVPAVI